MHSDESYSASETSILLILQGHSTAGYGVEKPHVISYFIYIVYTQFHSTITCAFAYVENTNMYV